MRGFYLTIVSDMNGLKIKNILPGARLALEARNLAYVVETVPGSHTFSAIDCTHISCRPGRPA